MGAGPGVPHFPLRSPPPEEVAAGWAGLAEQLAGLPEARAGAAAPEAPPGAFFYLFLENFPYFYYFKVPEMMAIIIGAHFS